MQDKTMKFIKANEFSNEIAVVVGTRPGIIMLAPIIHGLVKNKIPHFVIHTGQHYSPAMDAELFEDLNLPAPDYHLQNISNKLSHGGQTAAMLEGCEEVLMQRKPKLVLVNGDANTNLAAALAARKLRIAIGHIEAGERSFDWSMPEEHNRRMMDHISELLFTTNNKGAAQLKKESVMGQIHITGNTIVDASMNHLIFANQKSSCLERYGIEREKYFLLTAHREENVDDFNKIKSIIESARLITSQYNTPILFMAHPRTTKRLQEFNLYEEVLKMDGIIFCDAVRYLDFLQLLVHARAILTDSGGVQQESYIHKRLCVTLRENTEWTETLTHGVNRLSGATDAVRIAHCLDEALKIEHPLWPSIFGDGCAAERIIEISKHFVLNS